MSEIDTRAAVFSARHTAMLAGVTYRRLDYLCRTEPTAMPYMPANGSGSRRRFSRRDVRRVWAMLTAPRVACAAVGRALLDAPEATFVVIVGNEAHASSNTGLASLIDRLVEHPLPSMVVLSMSAAPLP